MESIDSDYWLVALGATTLLAILAQLVWLTYGLVITESRSRERLEVQDAVIDAVLEGQPCLRALRSLPALQVREALVTITARTEGAYGEAMRSTYDDLGFLADDLRRARRGRHGQLEAARRLAVMADQGAAFELGQLEPHTHTARALFLLALVRAGSPDGILKILSSWPPLDDISVTGLRSILRRCASHNLAHLTSVLYVIPDASVRALVLEVYLDREPREAERWVSRLLVSDEPRMVQLGCRLCRALHCVEHHARLEALLLHSDPSIQMAAVRALGAVGTTLDAVRISGFLTQSESQLRWASVAALEEMGGVGRRVLRRLARVESSPLARATARVALAGRKHGA